MIDDRAAQPPDDEPRSFREKVRPGGDLPKSDAPEGGGDRPSVSGPKVGGPKVGGPSAGGPSVDGPSVQEGDDHGGDIPVAPVRDGRRLRRKGQDPHLERGVDAKEMWRIFRIISEYVEAIDGLREIRPAISIWGSARLKPAHRYYVLARDTARTLATYGYNVITGGGPGIMEAANQGAVEGGGKSVGLGIELPMEQSLNPHVQIGMEFDYFFIRKMMFTKFAAGLVVAPGGFGTMDEMFDTLTLIQTRKIRRIPVVLLGVEFFTPLVAFMRNTMLLEGTISAEDLDLWHLTDEPKDAAEYLDRHIVAQTWWAQKTP